jgi:hypothetical protein
MTVKKKKRFKNGLIHIKSKMAVIYKTMNSAKINIS